MISAVTLSVPTAIFPANTWTSGNFTKGAPPAGQSVTHAPVVYTFAVTHALHVAPSPSETRITHAVAAVHGNLSALCTEVLARRAHPSHNAVGAAWWIVASVTES